MKEVVVLRIGFNPTRSTSPCYNPTHACNIQWYTIHTYTKMNLSTVKWAQWDKTQSRELLGLFMCVCIALCTTAAHNTAQNRPDNFLSYPPDNHHSSHHYTFRCIPSILLISIHCSLYHFPNLTNLELLELKHMSSHFIPSLQMLAIHST